MPNASNLKKTGLVALAGATIAATTAIYGGFAQNGQFPTSTPSLRSYADIVAADKPAVVTVTTATLQRVKAPSLKLAPGSPDDEFFRQFFGEGAPQGGAAPSRGREVVKASLGSGFVVAANGTIVTNNHVIDGASAIKVTLDDGRSFKAKLLGSDTKTDLAVLKIDAGSDLPTVNWGDSSTLRAGDSILAMGNPFGIGTTVTAGIVSARGRDLHSGPYDDFIQIDAPINHGNSGGPLVDVSGKVVGINTAIYSPNGGSVGVGFAIPSSEAQSVVDRLIHDGSIQHGYVGLTIGDASDNTAPAGTDAPTGALVAKVTAGAPAAHAGVKPGDVVVGFGGSPVQSPRDLTRLVADTRPGTATHIVLLRGGKQVDLPISVGSGPSDHKIMVKASNNLAPDGAG